MNQSEREANTCNRRERREIVHKPITFSFVLALRFAENKYVYCDWSISTRICLFKYKLTEKRRQSMFTFDSPP